MLLATDFAPKTPHFNGLHWMTNIEGFIDRGIIKSARSLKDTGKSDDMPEEDSSIFQKVLRKVNTSKLNPKKTSYSMGKSMKLLRADRRISKLITRMPTL